MLEGSVFVIIELFLFLCVIDIIDIDISIYVYIYISICIDIMTNWLKQQQFITPMSMIILPKHHLLHN